MSRIMLFLGLICLIESNITTQASTLLPISQEGREIVSHTSTISVLPFSPLPRSGGLFFLIGPTIGLARSRYNLSERENEISDARAITRPIAGAMLELIPANARGLSIETGIKYAGGGSRLVDEDQYPAIDDIISNKTYRYWVDRKERLHFLAMPLLVKYTTNGTIGFQFAIGLNFKLGQGGEYVISLKDEEGKTLDDAGRAYNLIYKEVAPGFRDSGDVGFGTSRSDIYRTTSLEFTLGFGLSIPMGNGGIINLRANYDVGATNLFNDNNLSDIRRQSSLNLSLGVAFPLTN